MGKKEYCCKDFWSLVAEQEILRGEVDEKPVFYIYGRPRFVDDGQHYQDNMTEDYQISFCPFCGSKLSNQ